MSREKLLIVDDDEEFLLYLQTALTAAGFDVSPAASAADALSLVENGDFAVVLADLRLPGASGLDVLAAARKKDPLSVGIVLTGHSSVDSAFEALREGVYDYIVKPCAPDQLLASVRRGLEHHALRRALIDKTAQLERQQRMIQNVSHELKNPLSVVYGYSSFLLRQEPAVQADELRKSLQSIHNNAERLGHLLEELLESSRLQGRKVELSVEALSARALCEEARANFAPHAEQAGVALRLQEGPDGAVLADPKRVQQILSNLLTNALKFTPSGGSITISCRPDEDGVVFAVADTGCGISPQDMPRVFERFYQVEATRKKHAGLGLGLEICKGLVELHGGRIWAESAPGQGATLRFTLPPAAASKTAEPSAFER